MTRQSPDRAAFMMAGGVAADSPLGTVALPYLFPTVLELMRLGDGKSTGSGRSPRAIGARHFPATRTRVGTEAE